MMYRKQFVALAEEIKHHNRINPEHAFDAVQLASIMRFLKSENPQFNAERWVGFIAGENGANGGRVKPAKVEIAA